MSGSIALNCFETTSANLRFNVSCWLEYTRLAETSASSRRLDMLIKEGESRGRLA